MKNIQISDELYRILIKLGNNKEDYDSVIYDLLVQTNNIDSEEFTDEQAEYYNECIDKLERGDFSQTSELDIDKLDDELDALDDDSLRIIH